MEMFKRYLSSTQEIKNGGHTGKVMAAFYLSKQEIDEQIETLKERYMGNDLYDPTTGTVYNIVGVLNERFHYAGQLPELGVLLKVKSKLVGEEKV